MRPGPLSVTELNEYVRRSLAGDPMLQGIAVRGEISNFKRHTSGHLYFTLKDEDSRMACVMFRQSAQMLRFAPSDGMRVVLSGSAGLYAAAGSYQFYGEAMSADGSGALYELFLKTKEALQKEGLFDASLKQPLPLLPRGIGIVTSAGGAVLHDIMTVANRRFPGIPMFLRPALVQGAGAAEDLAKALHEIASLPQVEVIIIGRGGGSLEDLWAFNDEVLVRAVAACTKPVISAVGHETDTTLIDYAADVRAPTPSAAAELAVPSRSDLLQRIALINSQLTAGMVRKLEAFLGALRAAEMRLAHNSPAHRISIADMKLGALLLRLHSTVNAQLGACTARTQAAIDKLEQTGPRQTLKRGYVIALGPDGSPVARVAQAGGEMTLRFYDGSAQVQTLSTHSEGQDEEGNAAAPL